MTKHVLRIQNTAFGNYWHICKFALTMDRGIPSLFRYRNKSTKLDSLLSSLTAMSSRTMTESAHGTISTPQNEKYLCAIISFRFHLVISEQLC